MNAYFVVLSHNEPEVFRLLNQLQGQKIILIDDYSKPEHIAAIAAHPAKPEIHVHALDMDFAGQRNYADTFIPVGDWVVTIDPDETFSSLAEFLAELETVETESARIRRHNVIIHEDGTHAESDEFHIRAFRNYPGKNGWKHRLHETPCGFDSETSMTRAFVLHEKSSSRCHSQHLFYEDVKKVIGV